MNYITEGYVIFRQSSFQTREGYLEAQDKFVARLKDTEV